MGLCGFKGFRFRAPGGELWELGITFVICAGFHAAVPLGTCSAALSHVRMSEQLYV